MTTLALAPAPAYSNIPEYVKTYGPEVSQFCEEVAYFPPDIHQQNQLNIIFARRYDGLSSAFETCVVVGRQNLKSGTFKQASLGWLFLFDERLVVYSAHEFLTAMEMFHDIEELCKNSDYLRKRVARVIRNHGEEAIQSTSGARLLFKTRTKGGGRGLSGRKVVLDEAWGLRPGHMGALLPVLSAQPDPQVIYGSAAGLMESDVLRDIRDRGRAGKDERLAYTEYCAPDATVACRAGRACTHSKNAEGCGCDKPEMWQQANPAMLVHRGGSPRPVITLDYVKAERRAMPVDEFKRERMGWWDEPLHGTAVISMELWRKCGNRKSVIAEDSPVALSFAVARDRSMSAIAVAGWRDDGLPHLEIAEYLPGTGWLMDRLTGIVDRRNPCVLILDPARAAGAFEKELRQMEASKGLPKFVIKNPDKPVLLAPGQHLMHLVTARDYTQACGALVAGIENEKLWHGDNEPLNQAAEIGRKRDVSGAWVWDDEVGTDITCLESVTLGLLGLTVYGKKEPPMPFLLR